MNNKNFMSSCKFRIATFFLALLMCSELLAGEKTCNCTTADIEKEISYLAKQLLEVTGKDEYTLKKDSSSRIMIGACLSVKTNGINLTCITPDLSPQEMGMHTGDIIIAINEINFVNEDTQISQALLDQIVTTMQAGDILKVRYRRDQNVKEVNIEVRELSHPGFNFKVSK